MRVCVCVAQVGVKAKKATAAYKSYGEKDAAAKSEFEQKMAETAPVSVVCMCACMHVCVCVRFFLLVCLCYIPNGT